MPDRTQSNLLQWNQLFSKTLMDDRHSNLNGHVSESPDESSPLLGQNDIVSNGAVQPRKKDPPHVEAGLGGENPTGVEEPSNKQLVIILGSIYLGVFLSALG